MRNFDQILDDTAKKYMIKWDLQKFKKTHNKLYITIIESMKQVRNQYNSGG